MYKVEFTNKAEKDARTCLRAGLGKELLKIVKAVERDPYEPTPRQHFEQLKGNLNGHFSRRIDHHNRVFYTVYPNTAGAKDENGNLYEGIVYVHSAWGHAYKKPNTNKT